MHGTTWPLALGETQDMDVFLFLFLGCMNGMTRGRSRASHDAGGNARVDGHDPRGVRDARSRGSIATYVLPDRQLALNGILPDRPCLYTCSKQAATSYIYSLAWINYHSLVDYSGLCSVNGDAAWPVPRWPCRDLAYLLIMAIISLPLAGAGQYINSESVCAHKRVTTGLCLYSHRSARRGEARRGAEGGNFSAGVEMLPAPMDPAQPSWT
jgi:hypothetical protein